MRRPLGAVERAEEREDERQREGESKAFDRKVKSAPSFRWDMNRPRTVHELSWEYFRTHFQELLKTTS